MGLIKDAIGAVLGSNKALDDAGEVAKTVTNGVVGGLDAIWYTDEEKAKARQAASETLLKFWDMTTRENTQQSKARRELARMSFQVYFFLILAGVTLYCFKQADAAGYIFEIVKQITWLIMAIAGIYFGPYQVSKVWKSKTVQQNVVPQNDDLSAR